MVRLKGGGLFGFPVLRGIMSYLDTCCALPGLSTALRWFLEVREHIGLLNDFVSYFVLNNPSFVAGSTLIVFRSSHAG